MDGRISGRTNIGANAVSIMFERDVMCYGGRQLPSLFIVGAQKCATTSIVHRLFELHNFSESLPYHDNPGPKERYSDPKERHFFDNDVRWKRGLSYLAVSSPPCGTNVVTLDGTPDYLPAPGAAARLAAMYGPERLARTTFVASLCEPMQRAQSTLYHFRDYLNSPGHERWAGTTQLYISHIHSADLTFRQMVHRDVSAGEYGGSLYAYGRYATQIDEWVQAVGHMHVIPLPLYSSHEGATIDELACVAKHRRLHAAPPPRGQCDFPRARERPSRQHVGSHPHPPLAVDLDPSDAQVLLRRSGLTESNAAVYERLVSDPRWMILPSGFPRAEYEGFLDMAPPLPLYIQLLYDAFVASPAYLCGAIGLLLLLCILWRWMVGRRERPLSMSKLAGELLAISSRGGSPREPPRDGPDRPAPTGSDAGGERDSGGQGKRAAVLV